MTDAVKLLQEVICDLERDVDDHNRDWKQEAKHMPYRYDSDRIEQLVEDLVIVAKGLEGGGA